MEITSLILFALFVFVLYFLISSLSQNQRTEHFEQQQTVPVQWQLDKGAQGESLVYQIMNQLEGHKRFISNLYLLKDNGETTEIDLLMIHQTGIYVFESKNYSGWIFGTERQKNWTQVLPMGRGRSMKTPFFNPIIQNKVHLKWLAYYLGDKTPNLHSFIVFSDHCSLKKIQLTSGKHHVVQHQNLLTTVAYYAALQKNILSNSQIDDLFNWLRPLRDRDEAFKAQHIENLRRKYQADYQPEQTNQVILESIAPQPEVQNTAVLENPLSLQEDRETGALEVSQISQNGQETLVPQLEIQNTTLPENTQSPQEDREAGTLEVTQISQNEQETDSLENSLLTKEEPLNLADLHGLEKEQEQEKPDDHCPQCSSRLILETATRGHRSGQQFLRCSNFPDCVYIKHLEELA